MQKTAGVYAIYNVKNCKLYVGSSTDIRSRWYRHKYGLRSGKHHNRHLQRAWNKYGEASFRFEIIEETSPDNAPLREVFWLEELQPEYNLMQANTVRVGFAHSEESKAAVGAASRARGAKPPSRSGIKLTPEQIAKREETRRESGWYKDLQANREARSKISKKVASRPEWREGQRERAKAQGFGSVVRPKTYKGRVDGPHSEDTRAKISQANKGKKRTPEQVEANRQRAKAWWAEKKSKVA